MFTKTGFSLLAAAGVAVGVVGMTMGGASGASTTCVPSDGITQSASPANGSSADNASTSSDAAQNAASDATGAAGPLGPQGPGGASGTEGNGNGTDPTGNLPDVPGPSGPSGANGLNGLNIDVHGDSNDATHGSATVTNDGSSVPNPSSSHQALLELRARSNANNSSGSNVNLSGTHATARSSITGTQPIISLHPGR